MGKVLIGELSCLRTGLVIEFTCMSLTVALQFELITVKDENLYFNMQL